MGTAYSYTNCGYNEEFVCPICSVHMLVFVNFDWQVVLVECPCCHTTLEFTYSSITSERVGHG